MNVLLSILAALGTLFAPAAPLVPEDVSVQTPLAGASIDATGSSARLVFVVEHAGLDAPALLTLEGDSVQRTYALTLRTGRNVLIDDLFPRGDYTITVRNVVTAGSNHVELGACGDDTTLATMQTTFKLDRFAIGTGSEVCEPAQA